MALIITNKKALFDYQSLERFEAGISLIGSEVKSIKNGQASLKGSFITLKGDELFLTNAHISAYQKPSISHYEPTRSRKLLLKKSEIRSLIGKLRTAGLTLVPLRLYTKKRLIKLEFAVAKGKKQFDKRESIRKKEDKRKMERNLKDFKS